MKTLSAPHNISFGITNKCNLACKHCLASSTTGCREFSREMLLNIIHQIRDMKIFSVSIFGGEPFMSEHFHFVAEELGKCPLTISVNTNGTLIDREEADWLARSKIRSYCISIDGSCAEVHDAFRGQGSFDKVIRGIEEIKRIKRGITLSAILTKFNYHDIENMYKLSCELGINSIRFNNVCYVGNAACYSDQILMTPAETFQSLDVVRELNKKYKNAITGSVMTQVEILDKLREAPPTFEFPLMVSPCGAAMKQCAIRPDGKVVPCEIIWDCVAGDLYETSLKDIWLNSPVMNQFREPAYLQAEEIAECVNCEYLRLCYLGHRCQPYHNPGKFMNKKLYCIKEEVFNTL
ncbi:MAG: radical SAM protein [Candidatus Omnitrophica bacterium]|nr:radical SAM protein [Candidatus Omnitrophota bacterium]